MKMEAIILAALFVWSIGYLVYAGAHFYKTAKQDIDIEQEHNRRIELKRYFLSTL